MSKNIVFEGWLTKSPPTKRIWRTKWRRRWFALRQSGELPGQYFLDYYSDRNCRRLKGTINLDFCEQVDAGLHMERTGNGSVDPKLRGSVFTIQTHNRTYHLEADSEADMEKWVDTICRVCGLRATDDTPNVIATFQHNLNSMSAMSEVECADATGPYIAIADCITGARSQEAFTFDTSNILRSASPMDRGSEGRSQEPQVTQPQRRAATDLSENESNVSDEDCHSTVSQSNIRNWAVGKTFTKLAISPKRNGIPGPPVPPRPPKTLPKDFHGPKIKEPIELLNITSVHMAPPKRQGFGPPSPGRALPFLRHTDDEDDGSPPHQMYCNLLLPPAVDRALKPRHSSIGHINHLFGQTILQLSEDMKPDVLQYLDLDLHSSKPASSKSQEKPRTPKPEVMHGKSMSAVEADSEYKTVDFLKTEAFNITRQDAEASRSNQH